MVISRDIAGLSKTIDMQARHSSGSALSIHAQDNFRNILQNVLTGEQEADAPKSMMSSIGREQLTLLVRALQIQMNSRLYNTVFNNALETNYLAEKIVQKFGGQIDRNAQGVSNNRQMMPKKEPFEVRRDVEPIIDEAAKRFDIDANLIHSIIRAESNYHADARSSKGAMGLMQLMPETARELDIKNPYDARENILGGARYLKMLLNRYNGQVDLALAAYNWGMGNLEKNPHNLPSETIDYIAKVTSYCKDVAPA